MEQIFEQAKDLHVVATMVYNNGTDEYAYTDAECTKKYKASELREVFVKGALIAVEGLLFKALVYSADESGAGAIAFIKPSADVGSEGAAGIELGFLMSEVDEEVAE